jgi:hypothetical protein
MTVTTIYDRSCKGTYRHVRVIEVSYYDWNRGWRPTSIRSKGVLRVVSDRGPLNVGKTERCAYAIAMREAQALADRLNAAGDLATAEDIIGAGGSA